MTGEVFPKPMTIRTRTLPQTTTKGERRSPIWKHIVGIARELLTMPARAEYFKPHVFDQDTDPDGYKVLYVRASNSRDLDKFTAGVSVAGRQIVCSKLGKHTWKIHTEDL